MHLYLAKILGIGIFAITFCIIEKTLFNRFYPKCKKSSRLWDDALVYALHLPLLTYIAVLSITSISTILDHTFLKDLDLSHQIDKFYKISIFVLSVWAFLRFISKFEAKATYLKAIKHDPTTIQKVAQVLKAAGIVCGATGVAQLMGFPLSGVIAFGGVGGIAVGFAAKDLFANFFGGLMVFIDRPFSVGDWIRSPDKEIEGIVEYIGWRHTRIRTFDKRPLFIPNSIFSTISVENPSRMSNRRIKTNISLSYDDAPKVEKLLIAIEAMLKAHPGIDSNALCYANLLNFGPHSLEVTICAYTKATDLIGFQAVQQDVLLKALKIVYEFDAKIAYPIRHLHMPEHSTSEKILP